MKTATRIARYQLLVAVVGAALWGYFQGIGSAAPAFCGGVISAALTFYTAVKAMGRAETDPRAMVMNFYRAESRKWVLAMVMFGLAATVFKGNYAPLITTFAATMVIYWFALLWD